MIPRWKKWIGACLAALAIADIGLGLFLWKMASEGPATMRARRDRLAAQAKLLRADVQRGQKIRVSLPQVGKDCDTFYHVSFLDSSTGYSQIEGDLDNIAQRAGVRISDLTYTQKEVKDRGVALVSITSKVEADYPAIIRFINGLERSKNFYLLDSLQLASANAGGIRLEMKLHTFFRT